MKIGTQELVIILIIVVLLIGPTQIPKLIKMFKSSKKEFQDGVKESEEKSDKN